MDIGKKSLLESVIEELEKNGMNDKDAVKDVYPYLAEILYSPKDSAMKEKVLRDSINDPKIQNEIRDFDKFKDFDFDEYKSSEVIPSSYENADMKDVSAWYDKAKKALDPTGKGEKFFSENPLYKLKPKMDLTNEDEEYAAFEAFADPYDDDESAWFNNLLDSLGYPDTPEGWEQLATDWNSVMSRKKWADKAELYPGAVKFLFGKTFDVMEDGKKPTAKDVAVDAASNVAWTIPGAQYIKGLSKVPVIGKGVEAMSLARTAPGQAGTFLTSNSFVPVFNEIMDAKFGTDTEAEKQGGLKGRAENAAINAAINMFTPGLVKMLPTRAGGMFGGFGMDPTKYRNTQNVIADFVDYGNKQNAAQRNLRLMNENAKDAAEVIYKWTKRFGDKAKTAVNEKTLGEFKADLPLRLKDKGQTFVDKVDEKGFDKGIREFFAPYREGKRMAELKKLAQDPKSFMEALAPYISSYTVNRLGTNTVGDLIRSRLGRQTRYWKSEEDEQ